MRRTIVCFSLLSALALASVARAETYALKAAVLRNAPAASAKAVDGVDANQTVSVIETKDSWSKIRLGVDVVGWLPAAVLSGTWIKVWKRERKLFLVEGDAVTKTFRIALGAKHPTGQKVKLGDGATPEGRYYLAELDGSPEAGRYGARSMRLSYPSAADARRGLRDGLIDKATYLSIVKAVRAGEVPPQHSPLGGSIRIHGGGAQRDWTLGCIALDDADAITLFDAVRKGTRIDVYASADEEARAGLVPATVLAAAKAQIAAGALYTVAAMHVIPMSFPGGDIPAGQAVCTDIVVRALRGADLDLQALVFEDRNLHPERYPNRREAPRPSIDHRRVGNLVALLRRQAVAGAVGSARGIQPGDVVVFDTGIPNGSPFDHIGIADDAKDGDGNLRAINIWTVGRRTSSMALIGKDYPTVAAWFRLGHPYAYR
jgi:uncharacterized protein YijF (DUF1287 family)